jgi:hypothetical protein
MEDTTKERKLNAYRESHRNEITYNCKQLEVLVKQNEINSKSLDQLEKIIDSLNQIWRNQNKIYIALLRTEYRDKSVLGEEPN